MPVRTSLFAEPVLVIDIGGTKVAAAVMLPNATICARAEIATAAVLGPQCVVERIGELGRRVLAAFAQEQPNLPASQQTSVASAGQIDRATGVVSYATFHLPGWIGFPLGEQLSAALGIPVSVDNDVNCHALAEAKLGAGRPFSHFLLAAVGTGIGGGIVIDGKLYRGRLGGAGEIGQLCIDPGGRPCSGDLQGCLEVYAASSVMVEASGYPSIQALAADYRAGAAIPAVESAAQWLGRGLALIAHTLAPEAILIGGSVGLLGARYLEAVAATLRRQTLPSHHDIRLLFSALGPDSGLIGAGLVVAEQET